MLLSCLCQSEAGPRPGNEDSVAFWQPEDEADRRRRGAIMVMADGVGGQDHGERASRLATELALSHFQHRDPGPAKTILREIFERANLAVYDLGLKERQASRMATTLSVAIFRDREVHLAHVGDTRMYLVRHEKLHRLTNDHSYVGMQVKLRLITEQEARASALRSVLTRSVGHAPIVRPDFKRMKLLSRDRLVQCTDGLYCFVTDGEIQEGVDRLEMREICPYLVSLATRRGTDDNLSVQVVQVDRLNEPQHAGPISLLQHPAEARDAHVTHEVQAGDTLDGRFLIEKVVSRSGMASIFQAKDLLTGETAAVKIPYLQLESDPGSFSRFQREGEIGKLLKHPAILRFLDVPEQSRPYIATEFLEGESLSQILLNTRPLPLADATRIASEVCGALAHMHEHQIIHRDLKPQNIMVCRDGSLRIIDFGIAKAAEMRRLTFAGFSPTFGTPDYMAPEQVKGKRGDERTDIYSLGAVLYEMATGNVPFTGDNPFMVMNARLTGDPIAPRQLNPEISPELEEIILHAMEREPHRRYASAAQMKAELDDPESVTHTERHKHLEATKPWKARWHGLRMVVLSVLIPILLFLLALLFTHLPRGHH